MPLEAEEKLPLKEEEEEKQLLLPKEVDPQLAGTVEAP